MDQEILKELLKEQMKILDSASAVLLESYKRVELILKQADTQPLTSTQKESCEALTARLARLCDFIFQKVFRSIDQMELQDEGSAIDRLNRMEKRKIIESSSSWRELRDLRNEIAHEYLIEKSDRVLEEAFRRTDELIATAKACKDYI